jgi:hypothetical protein
LKETEVERMAKLKSKNTAESERPMASPHSWSRTNGTYLAGRAYIDGADETAVEMETNKWGVDRLRLLVSPELRERFDKQRYLFNQAIWHGDLEQVRRESARMVNAWMALDRAAESAGSVKLDARVWEVALADGSVAAIVQDTAAARHVISEGRHVVVYTLEEIGRLLSAYPDIARVKEVFPGAEVTAARRSIEDPLSAIHDTSVGLDDEIPDLAAASIALL